MLNPPWGAPTNSVRLTDPYWNFTLGAAPSDRSGGGFLSQVGTSKYITSV